MRGHQGADPPDGADHALLQQPDVKQRMDNSGLQITGGPPEDFAAILKRDYDKYGTALRAAGVRPE